MGILSRIIEDGGEMTVGGELFIITSDDEVIGLSEDAASPTEVQAVYVSDIVASSLTGKSLQKIKSEYGTYCPTEQYFINDDDNERLIDVTPFKAQEWGMPPLNNNWCQIMTVPRENVYEAIDSAFMTGLVVFVISFVGFVGSVLLLTLSLCLAYRTYRARRFDIMMEDFTKVRESARDVMALITPMVVMRARHFQTLPTIPKMEDARNRHILVVLDTLEDIAEFKQKRNRIIFFSHQWLGFMYPDTSDSVQLHAMQRVVRSMVEQFHDCNIYVWLDYFSIAQRHIGMRAVAVESLPVYVSQVDIFVICAPDALHHDTQAPCGLDTYCRRGWCRTEILAKVCSTGLKNMYVCSGDGSGAKPFEQQDFHNISINVYEGDFTDKSDCEKLVAPILGLYSLILKSKDSDQMKDVKQFIDENKSRFFPDFYMAQAPNGKSTKRKLFKNLVPMMEEYIKELMAVETATQKQSVSGVELVKDKAEVMVEL